jgi:hypothetical protein
MNRRNLGLLVTSFLIFGLPAHAQQGSAPVRVVNQEPIPVTGTITGTTDVTQSGIWNVGISGTARTKDVNAPG